MAQVAAFGYLGALAQEAEPDQCPIRNLLGCRPPVGSEQPTGATLRIAELEQENRQLRQKLGQHPTQRLDEAYSLRAEEQRREAASRGGESSKKKQKSARRGRISTGCHWRGL